MRFATVVVVLVYAAFVRVAPAAPIPFSASFSEGATPGCCEATIDLTGDDGLALHMFETDFSEVISQCFSFPCDATGNLAVEGYSTWTASFEGQSIMGPTGLAPQSGIFGNIAYTAAPFVPDCTGTCTISLPITISGQIGAAFADHSLLFDMAVTGSGSMEAFITNISTPGGGPDYLIHGIIAGTTGTATPLPEPGTTALMLCGFAMLKRGPGAAKRM